MTNLFSGLSQLYIFAHNDIKMKIALRVENSAKFVLGKKNRVKKKKQTEVDRIPAIEEMKRKRKKKAIIHIMAIRFTLYNI